MATNSPANPRAGALSRFAHFAGMTKPKADDAPATKDDVQDVKDDVNDAQDDVEDLKDAVDDLEDRVDDVEDEQADDADPDKVVDPDEPPADKPEARAAYRKGKAKGQKAERARAGAIMGTKAAATNPVLAMHLAFDTGSSPKAALATLQAAQAGAPKASPAKPAAPAAKPGLDQRMSVTKPVALGNSADAGKPDMNTPEGVATHILAVARRAGVIK